MLAESNSDANAALFWLQGFFWLAAGVGAATGAALGIKKLIKGDKPAETKITEQPMMEVKQPVVVVKQSEFATKEEHNELKKEKEKLDSKIDENFKTLNHERRTSIAGLHEHIRSEVGKIRTEAREDNKATQDRIDLLPERLIRLLRETGAIGGHE